MKTILIVCKGNIYRSVIAELCMQKEIKKIGKEDTISVVSRSLQGTMGLPLPKHLNLRDYSEEYNLAKPYLDNIGIEIPIDKKSTPIDNDIIHQAEQILAMDSYILTKLKEQFPQYFYKIRLFGELSTDVSDIIDPNGNKDSESHQMVIISIHNTVRLGMDKLIEWLG